MGRDNFTRITNGVPGIQDRINLLYTYGVGMGTSTCITGGSGQRTQPARLFGLYPARALFKSAATPIW